MDTVVWLLVVLNFSLLAIAKFLHSYLSKKGENLATKEDITELTHKVEEVRLGFALQAEEHSQKNRLKLAALDRRLEIHQEAYTLWWHLLSSVHTDDVGKRVDKCQTWWVEHCVYLGPEVRDAFPDAFHAAHRHRKILRSDRKNAKANWARVERVGRLILKDAGLPGFGFSEEGNLLRDKAEPAKGSESSED